MLGCVTNLKRVGVEEIILLHVIYVSWLPQVHDGYVLKLADALRHILNAKMNEAAEIVEGSGLRVKRRIELGAPHREILKIADTEMVDMIVCGRERKGILGEIFVGSITDRIIRYGTTPVYIPKCPDIYGADRQFVEAFCRDPFQRVLYPTDWSECARNALQYLKGIKDAGVNEIVVAHVTEKTMKLPKIGLLVCNSGSSNAGVLTGIAAMQVLQEFGSDRVDIYSLPALANEIPRQVMTVNNLEHLIV